ncbi:MAG: DNA gyrase inhibitor YacG [Myxococcales bacterium]|jgi:endogenous inhibitor of DNA gyrase (YacG/DUF329 family)|nr:DNA gyrase inhibitor YacG [Myxococcales bacterium]
MEAERRCPTCRARVQWQDNPCRPFCSERCQLADLGGWVAEQYRIPGSPLGVDMLDDDESDPA